MANEINEGVEAESQETPIEETSKPNKSAAIAKRYKAKIAKLEAELDEARKPKPKTKRLKKTKQTKGFDYAEKSFLQTNNVKRDEFALAEEVIKQSGMSLDELVDSDYFRAKQKEYREHKASEDAIPESSDRTERSSKTTKDKPEYWIARKELPPNTPENQQLRREIVGLKYKRAKGSSKFTDTPVAKIQVK